jgi:hypothetical protein
MDTIAARPHICMGTNQPLPNLTPIVGGHVRPAPLYILTPAERQAHSRWFVRAVAQHVPETQTHIVPVRDAYDLAHVTALLQELADQHPQGCTVNITGGSKLLTLAAWHTLRRPQDHIFYVHPANDTIVPLHSPGDPVPIRDVLSLPQWLAAFGFEPTPDAPPQKPDQAGLAAAYAAAHQRLQKAAAALANGRKSQYMYLTRGEGLWLEQYVSYHVGKLFKDRPASRQLISDLSGPFKVRMADQTNVVNEIDAAIIYNNRLTLIEAKCGAEGEGSGAADAIYKLSRLCNRLGGWISQGVFVSARKVSDDARARAADYGVHVIDLPQLPKLREHLEAVLLRPNAI